MRECQVEGCDRSAITRGFCEMHYRRVLKTGKPGPPGPLRERGVCRVEGCGEPVDAKDLCHGHYQRLQRGNQVVDTPLRGTLDSCQVDGCDRKVVSWGFCGAHYKRMIKFGDPLEDRPIRRVEGDGYFNHGYKIIPVPKKKRHLSRGERSIAEHRFVMAEHLGRALTSDEQVHHKNGVRTDNRLANLELWSTSQPSGQRAEDLMEYAQTLIERYGTDPSQTDPFGYAEEAAQGGKNPR